MAPVQRRRRSGGGEDEVCFEQDSWALCDACADEAVPNSPLCRPPAPLPPCPQAPRLSLPRVHLETAPLELMPHAVFVFLQLVGGWQGGAFHRNAGHVLQV